MNCWLLPARGSSARLNRSAALSDSVNRCLGLSSSARLPVVGVDCARVERIEFVERRLAARAAGRAAVVASGAAVDLVFEPGTVEAVVVGDFADEGQDRVGRDRRADAGEPHGDLRHFVLHDGERHAIRLARGDAVGIGHADEQHIVVGERAIVPAQFLSGSLPSSSVGILFVFRCRECGRR